MADQLLWRTAT